MTEWTGIISMKRTRKLGYLIKEGIHNMFSHGFMSFAAVCVTVACLVIIGSFSSILYNLSEWVKTLERQNRILAFVDETYDEQHAKSLESAIRQLPNIEEAEFMSGEEAGKNFIASQGGGDTYEGIDATYFRDRIIITMEDNNKIEDTIRDVSQIQGIAEVKAKSELVEGFRTIRRVLNLASSGIIIVLLVVSLFVISNTIKLAMYDRRDEIGIMKMIGATDRFIRFPYFVEGFLIGILSGSIAFFLEWLLYDLFGKEIQKIDSLQLFSIIPFQNILWPMVIVFGAASMFVGIFGSVMSIRKFLDV